MFRQFLVAPVDTDFQRILWRPSEHLPVKHFLLTVTYGLASVPYLALRVLRQLATDEAFPEAAPILKNAIYVDDALFGGNDIQGLCEVRAQLIRLVQRCNHRFCKYVHMHIINITNSYKYMLPLM